MIVGCCKWSGGIKLGGEGQLATTRCGCEVEEGGWVRWDVLLGREKGRKLWRGICSGQEQGSEEAATVSAGCAGLLG
jgi:hypothetical protein